MDLEQKLFNAFTSFIESVRTFIPKELGPHWESIYVSALADKSKESWEMRRGEVSDPVKLIDLGNLPSFALNNKSFFQPFFGKEMHKLPTYFDTIREVRNKVAHYHDIDPEMAEMAFLNMIFIAKGIQDHSLTETLRTLKQENNIKQDDKPVFKPKSMPKTTTSAQTSETDHRKNFILSKSLYGRNLTITFVDVDGFINEYHHDTLLDLLGERITGLNCWEKYGMYTNSKKMPKFAEGLESVRKYKA